MIKDNQKYFNRLHVVLDALIVVLTYMLAWFLKFRSGIAFFLGVAICCWSQYFIFISQISLIMSSGALFSLLQLVQIIPVDIFLSSRRGKPVVLKLL